MNIMVWSELLENKPEFCKITQRKIDFYIFFYFTKFKKKTLVRSKINSTANKRKSIQQIFSFFIRKHAVHLCFCKKLFEFPLLQFKWLKRKKTKLYFRVKWNKHLNHNAFFSIRFTWSFFKIEITTMNILCSLFIF